MANSLNRQRLLYAVLIAGLTSVIISSIYFLLGGFAEIAVFQLKAEKKNIIGKSFTGKYNDPDLEFLWTESRALLQDSALVGNLTVVNYLDPDLNVDEVHQFIGISLTEGMAEIPSGFKVQPVNMNEKLIVFLSMHPWVRPRPRKINEMFETFATEQGLVLADYSIETHFKDNSLTIEMPIIGNLSD